MLNETNHDKTTLNEREGVELDQASAVRGSCKSWSSPVRGSVGQALSRSLVSQSFTMTIPIKCTLSGSSSQHISRSPAGEAKAAPLPIQTHKQTLQHIGIKTTPPRHSHSSILRRSTHILSCFEAVIENRSLSFFPNGRIRVSSIKTLSPLPSPVHFKQHTGFYNSTLPKHVYSSSRVSHSMNRAKL